MKAIGVKMVDIMPMSVSMALEHGLSACVDANNYNQEIGEKFALEKAKDAIWNGLGFVLQWAKDGLKRT